MTNPNTKTMENKKRTAKRWRESEQRMLHAITSKFGASGVVPINRVPLDMWPPDRTIGASCFQLNQNGWKTTGFGLDERKRTPAELLERNTGRGDLFKPENRKQSRPVKTTTTWFWGLYTKTIER